MYPSSKFPAFGSFVYNQVNTLQSKYDIENAVVACYEKRTGKFITPWKYLKLLMQVIKSAIIEKPDIIHAHYIFPTGFMAWLAKLVTKKPLIITAHGSDVQLGLRGGIWHSLVKFTLNKADFIIAVSNDLKNKIENEFLISSDKLSIIDCGVNTDVFCPTDKKTAKEKLGIPLEGSTILFVGNLIEIKGVNFLIEALNEIYKEEKINCIVIGDGPQKDKLKEQVRGLSLKDNVIFEGYKDYKELPIWYSAADIFVLPSLREGFGLVALEAMACGTPVVVSNVGGLPEFVTENYNGWLIEPGNVHELVKKLKIAIKEKDNKTIIENVKFVANEHAMVSQCKRVLDIYQKFNNKIT